MKTKTPQNNVGIMENTTKHLFSFLHCIVFFIILTLFYGVFIFIPTLCSDVFHLKNTTTQCKNENKNTTKQCKSNEKHHSTM
jgi:hypothetical protein